MKAMLLGLVLVATAEPSDQVAAPNNAAFERLKTLEGTWVGKASWDENGQKGSSDATVVYKVTAGGSAVQETISPGTPHEMVTLYHLDGGRLVLTHYCMAGNQPRMKLKAAGEKDLLAFEYAGGTNVTAEGMHMHGAKIAFIDADHIRATWSSMRGGKGMGDAQFDLARKK